MILITGATGYVGGRLLKLLEQRQHPVRCLSRHPERLNSRKAESTESVAGDVLEYESLLDGMAGVHTAYYLVHSMGASSGFEERDRVGAQNFARAAAEAGVKRIIYLGGLGDSSEQLSPHLRSRQEVGDILRSAGVQVIEFRASVIIGSGSLSFEMIRALTERLPIMLLPNWVHMQAQPIAISDVLEYLAAAIDHKVEGNAIYEIGGPDRLSYAGLMQEYAKQRGLKRWMISLPFFTPGLSSIWLGLVTPLYAHVGRKLIDSVRHSTVVQDDSALREFSIRPIGIGDAIALALRNEDKKFAETRWSDALSSGPLPRAWGGVRFGNRLVDSRVIQTPASVEAAFRPIRRIGGKVGWYYGDALWRLRGFLDLLFGGVGVRRGRRDPDDVSTGDAIDFWRVEEYLPNRLLRLRAEMKVPGRAWLEFEVVGGEQGTSIRQTALFDPSGLLGLAYWYALYPLHQLVFSGMLRNIGRAAVLSEMEALA